MINNGNDFLVRPLTNKGGERSKEKKAFIMIALAFFIYGFANFQSKLTKYLFEKYFDPVSFSINRSIATWVIGYWLCHSHKTKIIQWSEIKNKFWFLARTVGAYLNLITFIMCIVYFRASTASCIDSMYPAISIFFSTILLNEPFYFRYIVGLVICLVGALMIILNERKDQTVNNEEIKNSNINYNYETLRIIYGSFYAVANIITGAFKSISIKILANEKIDGHVQLYWVGLTNTLLGFLHILFTGYMSLYIPYLLFSFSNGVLSYLSNYLLNEGYKNIEISKTASLTYITIITVFILGVLILDEPIYFTDVIGTLMVISFNVYNVYVPVK